MTWWSWLLIWGALALTALAVPVLFALSYWRRGVLLLRQLADVAEQFVALQSGEVAPQVPRTPSSLVTPRDDLQVVLQSIRDSKQDRIAFQRSLRLERGKLLIHRNRQVK
ncbi:hypothetical protein [Rathayibacter toxicus]|uniref:Uncharacterized protein n=1 Tax=Rathayibacter toxicus TaxID=145458 RepID=A0A0C5BSK3_9MICO|nr:hypothetical protein [Rathayibacter toxicus]AJM77677.1 hypothetical protein TI83_06435 [Rathayibacter toxicus]ALS56383.1 hypothetical protein APU90_00045 [Rathayibacter toxicus]ALS58166.1 hypothetical protein APU90_10655 [Rathayibacter toxicus]KKM45374.1 hypothetical protein VT73_07040 [Rathayibacter toxicus]PPG21799.1 hypothetical protein C5D15_06250 [Rathayibacter toxicus]